MDEIQTNEPNIIPSDSPKNHHVPLITGAVVLLLAGGAMAFVIAKKADKQIVTVAPQKTEEQVMAEKGAQLALDLAISKDYAVAGPAVVKLDFFHGLEIYLPPLAGLEG